jgi:hypothetical protein
MHLHVFVRHVGRTYPPPSLLSLPPAGSDLPPLQENTHTGGANIPPPPPPLMPHGPPVHTPAGALLAPPSMHRVCATPPLRTNGGRKALCKRYAPLPLARAPLTCTGQGARNPPAPLWPAPVHVQTGASCLPSDRAWEQVCMA